MYFDHNHTALESNEDSDGMTSDTMTDWAYIPKCTYISKNL